MKLRLFSAACLIALTGTLRASSPAATIVVTNANDSGAGSLRQAILDSNASAGVRDEIDFNIPGSGVQTITPATPLPDITDPVTINGQSQPGYDNVHPLVQIDGSLLAAPNAVLTRTGGGIEVNALGIIRGPDAGIRIKTLGGNNIGDCTIGTDPTGTIARGNATHGIVIENSPANGVPFLNLNRQNVIAGNGQHGVFITGAASVANVVGDDAIGTDWTLTASVPNGGYGVLVGDASGADVELCVITHNGSGGVAVQGAVSNATIIGNTISSNGGPGISVLGAAVGVQCRSNRLYGNAGISIDLGGDGRTPNDAGDIDNGPNRLLNHPVLSDVQILSDFQQGRSCQFTVQLHAEPNTSYAIHSYSGIPGQIPGDTQVTSGNLVSSSLVTDATGYGTTQSFTTVIHGNTVIVATAVDPAGNTSELSDPIGLGDIVADSGACGGTGAELLLPLLLLALRRRIRAGR